MYNLLKTINECEVEAYKKIMTASKEELNDFLENVREGDTDNRNIYLIAKMYFLSHTRNERVTFKRNIGEIVYDYGILDLKRYLKCDGRHDGVIMLQMDLINAGAKSAYKSVGEYLPDEILKDLKYKFKGDDIDGD